MCPDLSITKLDNPGLKQPLPLAYEEEEINLFEYLLILLRYKMLILIIVFLAGAGAVIYSLMLTNIYGSEATIALRDNEKSVSSLSAFGGLGGMVASSLGMGGGGSLQKLEVVLKSRELAARVIDQNELLPILFSAAWDADKEKWRSAKPPTQQDAFVRFSRSLSVRADLKKHTLTVGFQHQDPQIAKSVVDYLLTALSNSLRENVMQDAAENLKFFTEQLQNTSDAMLREKIYALMAKEVEKETFAKAQKYYSFLVLDPPIAPDLDKKIKPKRSTICILAVLVAFMGAIMAAFAIEFCRKVKAEDPQRYQQLVDGLKLRRRTGAREM